MRYKLFESVCLRWKVNLFPPVFSFSRPAPCLCPSALSTCEVPRRRIGSRSRLCRGYTSPGQASVVRPRCRRAPKSCRAKTESERMPWGEPDGVVVLFGFGLRNGSWCEWATRSFVMSLRTTDKLKRSHASNFHFHSLHVCSFAITLIPVDHISIHIFFECIVHCLKCTLP